VTSADDFQARARREGKQAQEIAGQVLRGAGFEVLNRNHELKDVGVVVNCIAMDRQDAEWYFDVSGAFTSQRDGLLRTDTMWKTLGRANVLRAIGKSRLVFLTTNLPPPGSTGDRALRAASDSFFDAVEMTSTAGKARLRRYAQGGPDLMPLPGYRTAEKIYEQVALPLSFGASLAVPVDRVGPIPHVTTSRVVTLPYHLAVLVPSVTHEDRPIPPEVRVASARTLKQILSNVAGGCTTQEGKGSWLHPLAGVMDEDVSVIEAYCSNPFSDQDVEQIVSVILSDLDQHTAALVKDGVMYQFS
jgi:hypothetical protein